MFCKNQLVIKTFNKLESTESLKSEISRKWNHIDEYFVKNCK